MTNKELQECLKKFDDELEIIVEHEKSKSQFSIVCMLTYYSEKDKLYLNVNQKLDE